MYFLFTNRSKTKSFYLILGEKALFELVENFYQIMESDPFAAECLNLHELDNGKVPTATKQKLFSFLSGWLGGPPLFQQKYGPPKMRARHAHLKISEQLSLQWLHCMKKSLAKSPLSLIERRILMKSFTALTRRIQNS